MDNEIKTWLYDINKSIEEIDNFFEEGNKKFENFISDLKTKKAIERNLEIIGEALNRILKKNDKIKISNTRKIVDTRNRIIHGYDSISDDVLWGIIIKHLPTLRDEVLKLLKD
ncbi:hypothetical protein ES705_30350 [subsurface metagenome]